MTPSEILKLDPSCDPIEIQAVVRNAKMDYAESYADEMSWEAYVCEVLAYEFCLNSRLIQKIARGGAK